jgi:hypothetical protein
MGPLVLAVLFEAKYRIFEELPKNMAKVVMYLVVSSVDK